MVAEVTAAVTAFVARCYTTWPLKGLGCRSPLASRGRYDAQLKPVA